MEDLERILISVQKEDKKTKRRLNRRFIISEGLFQNYGDICPLPDLVSCPLILLNIPISSKTIFFFL